ncbi:hypothetical protein FB567DRAFT_634789 [Paraphoma chrysanthemicola]|uniref:Uncharacterized protein n=1 Tax=Paraphoma chrysanthemicola TaxID=798071 RepID=A0A8K0VRZ1_9PLEO|nr:hypothetical protein FB567DRAFT_634789 [Paraphoma chrysanthemicola]
MVVKSDYYTRSKSKASPGRHGSLAHPQYLDFLNDFDDGSGYQQVNAYKSLHITQNTDEDDYSDDDLGEIDSDEDPKGKSRNYMAFFAMLWVMLSLATHSPLYTAILLSIIAALFTTSSKIHITEASDDSVTDSKALERRQSHTDANIPATSIPLIREARHIFTNISRSLAPSDTYRGQHPDWQPRRLWSEALRTARPRFTALAKRIVQVAVQFVTFQLQLQLLITIAQTLGIHFSAGKDELGIFPRYWHNLTSVDNLFGVVGKEKLARHTMFVVGWWWDWIFGLTSLFLWHLPKALARLVWKVIVCVVTFPAEVIASGAWEEEAMKEVNCTVTEVKRVEPWVARLWKGSEETVTITKTR